MPHFGARARAAVVRRTDTAFVIQVAISYRDSRLEAQDALLAALQDAGIAATEETLRRFDADGQPILLGPMKLTSMGQVPKPDQTPDGVATGARPVSQGPKAGTTSGPLDRDARLVVRSTPRFARMIAPKDAAFGTPPVRHDLAQGHGRRVAQALVPDVADAVAAVALAQEQDGESAPPAFEEPVVTVTVGRDGTSLLRGQDTWRQALVGPLGFSHKEGQRRHTVATAATPESGQLTCFERFDRAVDRARANAR